MGRVLSRTSCIVWGFWSSAKVSSSQLKDLYELFGLKFCLRFKFPASGNAFQSWITFFAWNCAAGRGGSGSSWFSCLGVPLAHQCIPLKCWILSGVLVACVKKGQHKLQLTREMCMNSVNNSSQCHAVHVQNLEHLWFLILPRPANKHYSPPLETNKNTSRR